ncbi:hypothetical protein DV735_g4856, partial [Chaetothyriales sp. CBS 134920]
MAPVDILTRLKERHSRLHGEPAEPTANAASNDSHIHRNNKKRWDTKTDSWLCAGQLGSILDPSTAALFSVILTLLYVAPFYLSPATRPSPTLNRDAPSVIRARIRTVTLSCVLSTISTFALLVLAVNVKASEAVHLLGYWPISPLDILRACFLTILLFLGPLFELLVVDGAVGPESGRQVVESLSSWQGYRNFIAGPITEEAVFRSVLVPIHLLAKIPPSRVVLLTPLYFAVAHVHHFYEFTLTHPHTPFSGALLRSAFQFGYTTVFGWLATFIYGAHEWRPRSAKLGLEWTVAYYVLLVLGALLFYLLLWPLTASDHALAPFSSQTTVPQAAG